MGYRAVAHWTGSQLETGTGRDGVPPLQKAMRIYPGQPTIGDL
jgi:hypothetical protein